MKSLSIFMDSFGAILLAIIWIAPLLFAFWAATHSTSDAVNLNLFSPWTMDNFRVAWDGAPWLKYFINTFMLVTVILIGQFFLTTLAGFAFAQLVLGLFPLYLCEVVRQTVLGQSSEGSTAFSMLCSISKATCFIIVP